MEASEVVRPGAVVPPDAVGSAAPPAVVLPAAVWPLLSLEAGGRLHPGTPEGCGRSAGPSDCAAAGRLESHFHGNPFSSATVTQETATVSAMSRDTARRIARLRCASSIL